MEEEYHCALATNIVQELLHKQREREKEEKENRENAAQTSVAAVASTRPQSARKAQPGTTSPRTNYKEKVEFRTCCLIRLVVRYL